MFVTWLIVSVVVKVYLCSTETEFKLIIVAIITPQQGVSKLSTALLVIALWTSSRMLKWIATLLNESVEDWTDNSCLIISDACQCLFCLDRCLSHKYF